MGDDLGRDGRRNTFEGNYAHGEGRQESAHCYLWGAAAGSATAGRLLQPRQPGSGITGRRGLDRSERERCNSRLDSFYWFCREVRRRCGPLAAWEWAAERRLPGSGAGGDVEKRSSTRAHCALRETQRYRVEVAEGNLPRQSDDAERYPACAALTHRVEISCSSREAFTRICKRSARTRTNIGGSKSTHSDASQPRLAGPDVVPSIPLRARVVQSSCARNACALNV